MKGAFMLLTTTARLFLAVLVLICISSCSSLVAFDGFGKQNPSVRQCKNSPFALGIAQGDVATVQRLLSSIDLNKPYIGKSFLVSNSDRKAFPQIGFDGCKHQVTYLDIALNARNLEIAELLLRNGANPNLQFYSETKYSLDNPNSARIYSPGNSESKSRHISVICPLVANHISTVFNFPDVSKPGSEFNLNAIRLLAKYKGLETDCERRSIVEAYVAKTLLAEAKLLVELGANIAPATYTVTGIRAINADDSNGYIEQFTERVLTSPLHFTISKIPENPALIELVELMITYKADINDERFLADALSKVAKHPKGNAQQLMVLMNLAIQHTGNGEYLKRELIKVSLTSHVFCRECFKLLVANGVNFANAFQLFLNQPPYSYRMNVSDTLDAIESAGGDITRIGIRGTPSGAPKIDSRGCQECVNWFKERGYSSNMLERE